jgi:hypothetical protein
MQDIGLSDDDITRIADEDMIWNRNLMSKMTCCPIDCSRT